MLPAQVSSLDKTQAVIKGARGQVPAPLHAQETQTSSSWVFPGFYDSGDIPGPVAPNPREGGLGQAALRHLPKRASQDRGMWGQLRLAGLDCVHHGVHPQVGSLGGISFSRGLPGRAGRQLSRTSGVGSRTSIVTIPWTTVSDTSQVSEPFHVNQFLLFPLLFCL